MKGEPLVLPQLAKLALGADFAWNPFRPGIQIHRLYGNSDSGPSAALLRYSPGASIPYHRHEGYEHIHVLHGSQVDAGGSYAAGTLIINPPGTGHKVHSPDGCVVLVIWERPVSFDTSEL
jgi:anti-sigma factor ChrR (cupin superfamily)